MIQQHEVDGGIVCEECEGEEFQIGVKWTEGGVQIVALHCPTCETILLVTDGYLQASSCGGLEEGNA